jgi:PIN domain nuclease of toxin-antitoxin system
VRLLLDTHAFLWWLNDNPKLGEAARAAISDTSSGVWVSAASIWELAIKTALGKLQIESDDLVREISANGFTELPITARHAWAAGNLPRHHEDPFDRMLIAQAQAENLVLVSRDPVFDSYGIQVLRT